MKKLPLNDCTDLEIGPAPAGPIIGGVRACATRDPGLGRRNTRMRQPASRGVSVVAQVLQALSQDTIWRHPNQIDYPGVVAKVQEDKT